MACIVLRTGSVQLSNFAGLGKRMPWTMAAILLLGLGLIGIPFTAGFISKWYLLIAALEQSHWLAAAVIVGGSLLAIIYVWKVIEYAYLRSPSKPSEKYSSERIECSLCKCLSHFGYWFLLIFILDWKHRLVMDLPALQSTIYLTRTLI